MHVGGAVPAACRGARRGPARAVEGHRAVDHGERRHGAPEVARRRGPSVPCVRALKTRSGHPHRMEYRLQQAPRRPVRLTAVKTPSRGKEEQKKKKGWGYGADIAGSRLYAYCEACSKTKSMSQATGTSVTTSRCRVNGSEAIAVAAAAASTLR